VPPTDALAAIGGRWTLQILILLLGGPMRFTDLRRGLPGISAKLLTVRLRELGQSGLVLRGPVAPNLASCAYSLSPRTGTLSVALELLAQWQGAFQPDDDATERHGTSADRVRLPRS
jgi:DNA-binding HxlR family transcriptional regulator